MAPKLMAIIEVLEEIAPSRAAEEWDNCGLQVGHLSQEIQKILISLDPTLKAVKKASQRNAQLLLTHHPLIFRPISHLNQGVYPGDVISEALQRGISIVAAHTNLDLVQGGMNDILAQLFSLQNVEVLENRNHSGVDGTGLGRIGNLASPLKLSQMIEKVKEVFRTGRIKVAGHKNRRIGRVAVVGGAGGTMISAASRKRADLLITGDVRHHEALEAEALGLTLIDAGHFHTERAALGLFADHLKDALRGQKMDVVVEFYKDERTPMRYE